MLDRSNANAKILFRWVGGMAAEPVWEGDAVNFYVRDNRGGRLEEVICQPASEHELKTILRDDLVLLRRPDREGPRGDSHRAGVSQAAAADVAGFGRFARPHRLGQLLLPLSRHRKSLAAGLVLGVRAERSGAGTLGRLHRPGLRQLLFVRRPGKSPKCPSCSGSLQRRRPVSQSKRRRRYGVGAAVVPIGGRAVFSGSSSPSLVAVPGSLNGPVGSQFDLKLVKKGPFQQTGRDRPCGRLRARSAVALFNQRTGVVRLVGPGATSLRFQIGDLTTEVQLQARVRQPGKDHN